MKRPSRATVVVIVVALLVAASGWIAWYNVRSDNDDKKHEIAQLREQTRRTTQTSAGSTATTEDLLRGLTDLFGGDLGALTSCVGGAGGLSSLLGGGDPIPDADARTQYAEIAKRVEQERGLTFDHVPTPTFVDAAEMQSRVAAQIKADYPADVAQDDEDLYRALGVIDKNTDLVDEYAKFVGSQVAGYYDPDTGELVVLGDDAKSFDALEQTTIAHELEHALADQNLGFPIADTPTAPDEDKQLAGLALIEGDATLTMTRFQLGAIDLGNLLGSVGSLDLDAQTKALADAPQFFADQLLFPYTDGLSFVCDLESKGGWKTVDAAYKDAPATTAQILFPDRYSKHEAAVATPAPKSPGAGWEQTRTTTFGAADLMFLLESAHVNEPRDRAAAWAGGTVTQWRNGDNVSVGVTLAQHAGHDDLCDSVKQWAKTVRNVSVACANDRVSFAASA